MQIGILEPDRFSPRALARLAELGPVRSFAGGDRAAFLAPLQALFVRLRYPIDAALLAEAPALRYLCSPTTGHTHIDEAALARRGVRLLSLRGEQAFLEQIRATPEHTLGLILALLRRYRGAFLGAANPDWDRDRHRGEELHGNTVGLIGYGRVGRRVAGYCRALGAQVGYVDPAPLPAHPDDLRVGSVDELIERSRIVVLTASHDAGAAPILDAGRVARLRGRYLVNTARGELVDEPALLAAIGRGEPAGVATDVIADETGNHRLAQWLAAAEGRNVIVTPHIAGATVEAMQRTEEFMVEKLCRLVAAETGAGTGRRE